MIRILVLAKKELSLSLNSPVAYLASLFFLVSSGVWFLFFEGFLARNQASLRGYFGIFPLLFVLLIPALTMRIWAEERRLGTDEVLFSLPYTETELVLGKYLGVFFLLGLILVLTLPLPLMAGLFGRFDAGLLVTEYLGVLLLASVGAAAGGLMSSLSANQVSAYIFGVVLLLGLTLAHQVNAVLAPPEPLAGFLRYLSLANQFEGFSRGVIDSRAVAFFLLTTTGFLFATHRSLVLRKWR